MERRERAGVLAGIASSAIGGMATAVTRFAVATMDPLLVTMFRFGIASLLLMALALVLRVRWPRGIDLVTTVALGVLFYGAFFLVFARALTFTTAARGALGISTLPVLTMLVAAALGREALTLRKTLGVLVALGGVALALSSGLADAPAGAWQGDLIMIAAMLSMSLYTIYSKPVIGRSSALGYACAGMAAGAGVNLLVAVAGGGFPLVAAMQVREWSAALFLGFVPGAIGFFLWVYATERTTPTRLASTITVNPITAGALATVLVGEPFGVGLMAGVIAVAAGIWIASTEGAKQRHAQ